jgi:carboxymethylenebutenolidase
MRTPLVLAVLFASPLAAQEPSTPQGDKKITGWTGVLDEKEFARLHELRKDKAPELHGQMVDLGDGKAYLSLPKGDPPFSAVLVIHEWWGLNDHIKHWADRLAALGYAALAVDLYRGVAAKTRDEAMAAMKSVDEEQARATLQAAHAFLGADERIRASKRGVIGWCFGGAWSLKHAIATPHLDAAVIYYGQLVVEPEELQKIKAPVLGIFGTKDRGIPPSAVDAFAAAMEQAGRKLELQRYDAEHAFANPSGGRYDEKAAAAAWEEVRRFFAKHLRPAAAEEQARPKERSKG